MRLEGVLLILLLLKCLAMTYSRVLDAHYHWRWCVSLPSSGWDRVVPHRYGRQAKGLSLGLMLVCAELNDDLID